MSDEAVREPGDFVELLLDLGQCGAVAVRLLRHVHIAKAQTTGVAVDDVSHQQLAGLALDTALDLEVDVDAAVLLPRRLDNPEGSERDVAKLRQKFWRDAGVAAVGEASLADEVARLDVRTDGLGCLVVRDEPSQDFVVEVELE